MAFHEVASVSEIGIETPLGSTQLNIIFHIRFVLKLCKDIVDTLSTASYTLGSVIPIVVLLKKKRK